MRKNIILLIFILNVNYLNAQEPISENNNKRKRYIGITAGYRYSYMNSNIDWADIYNNYCYNCVVGYYKNGFRYFISMANYEEKELIKERNIPSYINKGFNIGINYLAQLNKVGNFYHDVSLSYVDQGKFYYSLAIDPVEGTSGKHLFTYIPLVYYIAEIKTLDFNYRINYTINVVSNKLSLMPFAGINRSHILHTLINAYEFEGNGYIGKFKRKYYRDKYFYQFSNILLDRAYQLNAGMSVNFKVKENMIFMLNYSIIQNNIKIWKTMLKNEEVLSNGYMLLHNAESVKIVYSPQTKPIQVIEFKVVYKI